MTLITILFTVGLILLLLEAVPPGAIVGIIGGCLMLAAVGSCLRAMARGRGSRR